MSKIHTVTIQCDTHCPHGDLSISAQNADRVRWVVNCDNDAEVIVHFHESPFNPGNPETFRLNQANGWAALSGPARGRERVCNYGVTTSPSGENCRQNPTIHVED